MRILIQAPEGLKTKILEIADQYEDAIIDLDTCYGSCDIKDNEAIELKCDKIIHFGHNKLIESKVPVQYNELRQNLDFIPLLKQNIDKLPNKIGLVTSLQFLDSLESIKNYLESIGKKVFIGKSEKLYKGQILGCDIVAGKQIENKVECFLYFGSGKFHALGLALSTNKPVYVLNYEMKKLELLDTRKFEKQKYAAIELFKQANIVGILVSTKKGQNNIELAEIIKNKIKQKKSYILVMNEITPEKLEDIKVDAYINTACPRIAVDNRANFKKPIVNWDEVKDLFKS
ncbi:MAG: diphthamide biosynthesis enzyme Dph2 [Candidatus Aenigmarchaeota archaeon]|nr:diphthamide biosynthesis enzyme Dph2 [Candidatus Aenigmarchaeota archaeon]